MASIVHSIQSTDDRHTVCGKNLSGYSNRRAPICSTNPEHVTCESCVNELAYREADEQRATEADRAAWASQDA